MYKKVLLNKKGEETGTKDKLKNFTVKLESAEARENKVFPIPSTQLKTRPGAELEKLKCCKTKVEKGIKELPQLSPTVKIDFSEEKKINEISLPPTDLD
jgi:hypothetical protein